jgi:hypothetical protein
MQQDLEDEKNKTIIQDLAEKVENHEANLKKKDSSKRRNILKQA